MPSNAPSKSSRIRAKLDHPVIDADGHMSEMVPLYLDFVRQVAGPEIGGRYAARFGKGNVYGHTVRGGAAGLVDPRDPEIRDWRTPRGPFWSAPWRNLDDCATRYLPKLLHERMDDMGLDFAFLYPGIGLALPHEPDEQIRLGAVRALNTYYAELTRGLTDRMAVAAVIPMYNPREAIAELEHVTGSLGAKAIMIPPGVWRPIPGVHREHPDVWPHAGWLDNYGVDSEHDYDPFWQRCMDLKVAVTCHGGMVPCMMWNGRSMSNFTFNHLGNMALQQSWTCKSLLMGGITTRFPKLPFAFLECGVGWACMLYADLIARVLEEAYELVEDERIGADDFREFAFENAAMLHLSMNPDFFKGTRVEQAAAALLAKHARQTAGAVAA